MTTLLNKKGQKKEDADSVGRLIDRCRSNPKDNPKDNGSGNTSTARNIIYREQNYLIQIKEKEIANLIN